VEQPKVPQTLFVGFFHPLRMTLQEVGALDRLNNRWVFVLMGGADISRSERTLHAIAFQLPIHRGHPFEKAVVCIAWLIIGCKGHADG
jgi:hypothetical protein